jgi:hypothetical protein
LAAPIFVWSLLWINFKNLNKKGFAKKFSSAYSDIKRKNKAALLYNVF